MSCGDPLRDPGWLYWSVPARRHILLQSPYGEPEPCDPATCFYCEAAQDDLDRFEPDQPRIPVTEVSQRPIPGSPGTRLAVELGQPQTFQLETPPCERQEPENEDSIYRFSLARIRNLELD